MRLCGRREVVSPVGRAFEMLTTRFLNRSIRNSVPRNQPSQQGQQSFIHGPHPLELPAIIAAVWSTAPTHNKTVILSPTRRAHVNIPLITCHGSPHCLLAQTTGRWWPSIKALRDSFTGPRVTQQSPPLVHYDLPPRSSPPLDLQLPIHHDDPHGPSRTQSGGTQQSNQP